MIESWKREAEIQIKNFSFSSGNSSGIHNGTIAHIFYTAIMNILAIAHNTQIYVTVTYISLRGLV
jgi:hypothetical protein